MVGVGEDVLGASKDPVLSFAASQSNDDGYHKAGTQMLPDTEYTVKNINPIICLYYTSTHLHHPRPTGYALDHTKYVKERILF